MKIFLVIHGYPMRYNAGSEVYTQGLALELAYWHEVHVFTRQENSFLPENAYSREVDPLDSRVTLHVMNMGKSTVGPTVKNVPTVTTPTVVPIAKSAPGMRWLSTPYLIKR